MANYSTDPITGILVPTPGVDPGPEYAQLVSNALFTLAHLKHTGEANQDGYQIPSAGINFDEDISAQGNDLTNLRSTRYNDQSFTLNGAGDLDCVYFKDGDLWINNGSGTPVQVTAGSLVNATVGSNYVTVETSNNITIDPTDTTVVIAVDTSTNTITVTLPLASDVSPGRFFLIKDATGDGATRHITVNPNGADTIDETSTWIIRENYAAIGLVADGNSNWYLFQYNRKIYNAEDIKLENGSNLRGDSTSGIVLAGDIRCRDITANGDVQIDGALNADQDVTFAQELHVVGDTTIGGDLNVNGDNTVAGQVTAGSNAVVTGFITATGAITSNTNGVASQFLFKNVISLNRVIDVIGQADPANWKSDNGGLMTNVILGTGVFFYPMFPNGVKITSVRVGYQAAGAHTGLPDVMPTISLKYYDIGLDLTITVGSQADTSATVLAFQTLHEIIISGLTHTVDTTGRKYFITVSAENDIGLPNGKVGAKTIYLKAGYDRLANSLVGQD